MEIFLACIDWYNNDRVQFFEKFLKRETSIIYLYVLLMT